MKIRFRVVTVRPDQRQYRQTSLELEPDFAHRELIVTVDVPDKHVFEDKSISIQGLKDIMDQFDNFFELAEINAEEDEWE